MEYFLLQLAKTSVICSAAIVLLLLLRPLLRKRFAAKARCRIWLVVALALIFAPFCPGKHAPVKVEAPGEHVMIWTDRAAVMPKITHKSNFVTLDDGTVPALSGVAPGEDLPQSASAAPARRMLDVSAVLFWAWLAGAAVFLIVQLIGYGSFRRLMRRWSGTVTNARYFEILSEEAERLGVAAPKAQLCAAVSTPALTGLFRPTLLLPHENYTESDLRFILRHELTHLKRRDILYKLVLTLANALHWFNPLSYVMLHLADEDIELSCDSAVTLRMEKAERAAYSETLLKAVRSKSAAVPLTTCFGGTVERLKRRLANVLDGRKKSRGGAVLALTVLAVAGLCAAIGFTPAKDASPDRSDAQGEYAGMEEYVLSVIDKLKQPNGYTYSILPEEGSADGLPVEVTEAAADVRVVELEQEGVCMDLAPDGTLELWRFCYEVKPEDKAGALPDRFFWVGGNNITDDGYISDGWYYYLTMLRTDDDPGVYKLLDSSMANDGLWYNGCHYDSAYEYLYDFYADYAKLDVPRYLIPDFLNADDLTGENVATTSADREARRYDGDGWCLYIPTVVWRRTTEAGEDCWYSAYWTGSALRVDKSTDNAETMEAFYRDNGFTLEQYREGAALRGPWYRYDADSGTQFANYLMPIAEGGCYIISTWWMPTDDDSVNEWGYSKKNQIENEAAQLRSMAQSFTVDERFAGALWTDPLYTDALSAFSAEADAAEAIAYCPSVFSSTLGGLVADSDLLRELKAALASIQPVSLTLSEENARKIPLHSDGFILYDTVPEDSSPFQKPDYYLWNGYIVAAKDMSVVGQLNSEHRSTFSSAWNRQSHRNAERSADSEPTAPKPTAESIKASALSFVDYSSAQIPEMLSLRVDLNTGETKVGID